jgi:hypothetical protein
MPVPDFSPGEVLTAAAMDSIGLWLVGSTTSGATVSTITLDNIFSATYNAYKIFISGGTASTTNVFQLQLLDSGGNVISSGYYETFIYSAYSGSSVLAANGNNLSNFQRMGGAIANSGTFGMCDLINPFIATPTIYTSSPRADAAGGNAGQSIGQQSSATSCRGIKLTTSSGTVTGVNVNAYGYRLG